MNVHHASSKKHEKLILEYKKLFLKTADDIKSVIHSIPPKIPMHDAFSQILRHVFQILINDNLIATEILIDRNLLISAAKISRPMLEISGIVSYLYRLSPTERETKSKSTLRWPTPMYVS